MPELRILPRDIADLIAAGEVVQRPASVVKELMENSVDAGATKIEVIVRDSGRTLIQVIDDGCGMTPDEAALCFARHATSKVSAASDLEAISTYGFRGEALASIAAVSRVTLKTRTEEAEVGCQVDMAASEQIGLAEAACPRGCNVSVRDLFYNVPARRRFLKSDKVELRHIMEEFTRVALTREDLSLRLSSDGRDAFSLKPAKSRKYRIQDLLGEGAVGQLVELKSETPVIGISGFVGSPDQARKTAGNQFLFVGGRFFRSQYLHKAVMRAYEGMVAEGAVPSYFIWLDAKAGTYDVNISPTKTEVKFEDEPMVFQVLYATVREALGRNAFSAAIDFDMAGATEMPVLGSNFRSYHPASVPVAPGDPSYNPFEQGEASSEEGRRWDSAPSYQRYVNRDESYGRLFEDKALPSAGYIVVDGRYMVTKSGEGLLAMDISRAWERILYDRFLTALTKNGHTSQEALFPVQVTVGAQNRLAFDEHEALLTRLGFDIAPFGDDTIVVNGVPDGFSTDPARVQALMADVLVALTEEQTSLPGMMEAAVAERFALVGARQSATISSPQQAQSLADALLSSSNPEFTSRGKRIISVITSDDLAKRF